MQTSLMHESTCTLLKTKSYNYGCE